MRKYNVVLFVVLLGCLVTVFNQSLFADQAHATGALNTPAEVFGADWRQKWDNTVIEAKKEGRLVVYAASLGGAARKLTEAFKDKYGITLDIVPGRGEELVARIAKERSAGIYAVDVGFPGMTWYFASLRPMAVILPIQPLLILPEVLDPSKWLVRTLPMGDKDGKVAVVLLGVQPYMVVNSDIVKPGEITSISDILQPKWRGKIVMNDPSVGGAGAEIFAFTVGPLMGREKGTAFMKALARQEPMITRDLRLMTEGVARGKYAVGWGPTQSATLSMIRAGGHLYFPDLKEPRPTTSSSGNIVAFDKAPHPNAAKVFVNWLLTKEGSTVFSQAFGLPSTRSDVPTEGIYPAIIAKPGEGIMGEDYQIGKGKMRKLAAEIFRDQIR